MKCSVYRSNKSSPCYIFRNKSSTTYVHPLFEVTVRRNKSPESLIVFTNGEDAIATNINRKELASILIRKMRPKMREARSVSRINY
jgi:hypothetical protein